MATNRAFLFYFVVLSPLKQITFVFLLDSQGLN